MSEFIPVGMTAMRDPVTGELLPAVPLYVEVTDGYSPPMQVLDRDELARDIGKKIRAKRAAEKAGKKG